MVKSISKYSQSIRYDTYLIYICVCVWGGDYFKVFVLHRQ